MHHKQEMCTIEIDINITNVDRTEIILCFITKYFSVDCLGIKMPSCLYRHSHCKDVAVSSLLSLGWESLYLERCHLLKWVVTRDGVFVVSPKRILNSLDPGDVAIISKVWFSNLLYEIVAWTLFMKLLSGECHRTSLIINQYWFR